MIHPMQYALLHSISVISSWVEFLAAAVGGRRNRHLLWTIAALREQPAGSPLGHEDPKSAP